MTENTKDTITYGQGKLSVAGRLLKMNSFSRGSDCHSSEARNVSNKSASSKQYPECNEKNAKSEASAAASLTAPPAVPHTAHPMKWYYLDGMDEILESYDQVSEAIEQSYLKGAKSHELPEDETSGQKYLIDFAKMEEYEKHNPEDKVVVLRREDIMMKGNTEVM